MNSDKHPLHNNIANPDISPEQISAIKHVKAIGDDLAKTQGEVLAQLAHNTQLTYKDIAEALIPDTTKTHPGVAEKAIGHAIRQLIPPDDLSNLTHERRSRSIKELMQSIGDQAFREHQRAANLAARQKGKVPDIDAMLSARGRTAWTNQEKEKLVELLSDPHYRRQEGSHKDTPDYEAIASELNRILHNGENIRYSNSVGSMTRDMRRNKS